MSSASQTSYDDVPYPSSPMPQTHPDRLATVATLLGMSPAPVDQCRVLELGCATGGNLIGMAQALPQSQFVGIDLSPRQIEEGRGVVQLLNLGNIELLPRSILDVTADFGLFDYIICHGVYSWVPPLVQDKILSVCQRNLAEHGVAFVSYNLFPGWHCRGMVREMMRFHTQQLADPQVCTAAARELLNFLIEATAAGDSAYHTLLKEEQELLSRVKDSYIFHEHLEEVNEPVYFHEFVERAAKHGLDYLGDAEIITSLVEHYPPHVTATLGKLGGNILEREQYLDFLKNRMFRQTLLCHAGNTVSREPKPASLASLHVASDARSVSPVPEIHTSRVEEFRASNGVAASTSHAISKSAMTYLAEIWPKWISFDELQTTARARLAPRAVVIQDAPSFARDTRLLAENLLHAFTADVVELHAHAPRFVSEVSERPRSSALGRYQARNGPRITSLRHAFVELDSITCLLLQHLDGEHDCKKLEDILVETVIEKQIPLERFGKQVTDPAEIRAVLSQELDVNLRRLARSALLMG